VRSAIGRTKRQKDTIAALGLRRIGDEAEHEDNPAVRGMVRAVEHLLEVQEVNE
jgi:large subunit ribosomal protein L30